jgi:hypothetical protein
MLNSSDNIISQYTGAFRQLKERFGTRSSISTLKVLRNVTQGVVQLSSTLDDLKDMGKVLLERQSDFFTRIHMRCRTNKTIGEPTWAWFARRSLRHPRGLSSHD